MTPRDQAIEEARKALADTIWQPLEIQARATIDAYESARARIDGAKMMPREATEVRADGGCLHCTADQGESHRPGCPKGG